MAKKQRFEQIEGLPEALENKADKADVVNIYGNQTVNGSKRFSELNITHSATNQSTSSGWHRVAKLTGRGYFEVGIHFSGGSFTPSSYICKGFLSWSGSVNQNDIQIDALGRGNYIRGARIVEDAGIYLEVLFQVAPTSNINQTVSYLKGLNANVEFIAMIQVSDLISGNLWAESLAGWDHCSTDFTLVRAENIKTTDYGTAEDWYTGYQGFLTLGDYATTNEINNIYDQLSAKANERLSNVASNLSNAEKDALLGKIGAGSEEDVDLGVIAYERGDFRDYGLGKSVAIQDIDNPPIGSFFYINSLTQNFVERGLNYGVIATFNGNDTNGGSWFQLFGSYQNNRGLAYRRKRNGTIYDFIQVVDESNLNSQATSLGFIKSADLSDYALLSQVYTKTEALGLFVSQNGAQTIYDTKTFDSAPIVPNGTLDSHTVNLGQLNTILGDYATEAWVDSKLETIELTPGPQGDKPAHQWNGTSVRFENPNGSWGTYVNLKGDDGSNGSTWYNGVSNPTTQGVVGDWYIKTSTWDVYRKISSNSWNHYGNIKGEDGVPADVSNKANIDGSNTAGGDWKIDNLKNDAVGLYVATYSFDNGMIGIPPTDALGSADGILLMRDGAPLAIAENINPDWDGYIYRAGEPKPGYPDHAKNGNYLIESKHRFRLHTVTAPDSTSGDVGFLQINPFNAIEHNFFRVTVSGVKTLDISINEPYDDEITGFQIRRNAIGQKCTVAVSGGMAGVIFTNVAGADFTAEWKKGVFTFYWTEAGWLFGGYSPIEP